MERPTDGGAGAILVPPRFGFSATGDPVLGTQLFPGPSFFDPKGSCSRAWVSGRGGRRTLPADGGRAGPQGRRRLPFRIEAGLSFGSNPSLWVVDEFLIAGGEMSFHSMTPAAARQTSLEQQKS